MSWPRVDGWRLLWLASLSLPAAANAAPDSPTAFSVVVLATPGVATLTWGFALQRRGRANAANLCRATALGGAVLAASWLIRGAFDGASLVLAARRSVIGLLLTLAVVGTLLAAGAACAAVGRPVRRPTLTEALAGLGGFILALAAFTVVGVGAAFTVGYFTQSTPATAVAAIVGVGLLVGLPSWTLLGQQRPTTHALGRGLSAGAALTITGLVALAAWAHFGPYGLTSQDVASQLGGSAGSDRPAYYLGDKAAGMRLVSLTRDGQKLIFEYGRCMEGGDPGSGGADSSCTAPVEVTSEPTTTWAPPDGGCVKTQPILGVPAVIAGRAATLFTGPDAVTILAWTTNDEGYLGDPERARDLAKWVHQIGSTSTRPTLPPPDPGAAAARAHDVCGSQ